MSMRQESNATAANRPRTPALGMVYEEFSPITEWKEEEQSRILLVHLPGFRKEQLKVATEGTNNLRVRGERLTGGRKRSRFQEEYQIPTDSTIKGIHAKFENGILTITMPKINVFHEGPDAEEAKLTHDPKETIDKPKDEALQGNAGLHEALKTMLTSTKEEGKQKDKETIFKNKDSKKEIVESKETETAFQNNLQEPKGNEKWAAKAEKMKKTMKQLADGGPKEEWGYIVNFGVGILVIVAIGACMSYVFRSYGET